MLNTLYPAKIRIEKKLKICQSCSMPSNIDKEKAKKTIALVLEKVKTEADPALLEEYHSLYKKEVSLFNRTKAAAYLFMLCDQGKSLRYGQKPYAPYKSRTEKRPASDAENDSRAGQRYPLAEEDSKRLFFSAGRSRRVYPREILGLINTKTAIPKENIGAIRILDNYSFVQVRDTVAEQIIEALNGQIFRGRPLTVNYAKSRRDEKTTSDDETYEESTEESPEESPTEESEEYDDSCEQEYLEDSQEDCEKENI